MEICLRRKLGERKAQDQELEDLELDLGFLRPLLIYKRIYLPCYFYR
jgi:hypothetical protein